MSCSAQVRLRRAVHQVCSVQFRDAGAFCIKIEMSARAIGSTWLTFANALQGSGGATGQGSSGAAASFQLQHYLRSRYHALTRHDVAVTCNRS